MAKSLNVTSLDFDGIKQNLKNFLAQQSEFEDYDFEGSGLSVLLDVLAYNTHYNAFYANMAVNEMFLDSAVKRASVVSLAKMLNYTPKSAKSAMVKLTVTLQGVAPTVSYVNIPRYTPFSLTFDNTTYTYYNIEPYTVNKINGVFTLQNIEVYEGTYAFNTFTSQGGGPAEKYELPNLGIDTSSLRVSVSPSSSSSDSFTYTKFAGDITTLGTFTKIYFLDENTRGFYEIYFGDGVLGQLVNAGAIITAEYLVTSGMNANISSKILPNQLVFTAPGGIAGYTATITVQTIPVDGADPEDIDAIRFNAPKYSTLQNRLVTKSDFAAFLKRNFDYIDEISTWGGEDNDPPDFGKVFISILTKENEYLTQTRKNDMLDAMQDKKMMSTRVEFTEPTVIYLNAQTVVKYNPNITNKKDSDIVNLATAAVVSYFSQNLGTFERRFSYSKLLSAIASCDNSILSASLNMFAQQRIMPDTTRAKSFKISLPNNKFLQKSIDSSAFYYFSGTTNILAKFIDEPNTSTVSGLAGTFKRFGRVVTLYFNENHNLNVGERVVLEFSSVIPLQRYTIVEVPDAKTFVIHTGSSGSVAGTVKVTSYNRGTLKIVALNNSNNVLNPNAGYVSYQQGLMQINNLIISGYAKAQTFIQMYFQFTADTLDIDALRNTVVRLDDSESADSEINRLAPVSVSVTQVPL